MSIESRVYTEQVALTMRQLVDIARSNGLELRAHDPDDTTFRPVESDDTPLYNVWYVLIGWPCQNVELTTAVDDAMSRGDKAAVDRLAMSGQIGWFELSCQVFNYEEFSEEFSDDLDEFEESFSPEDLELIRRAQTEYFFRCGTRPEQNGRLLCKVATIVRDSSDGFLDSG